MNIIRKPAVRIDGITFTLNKFTQWKNRFKVHPGYKVNDQTVIDVINRIDGTTTIVLKSGGMVPIDTRQ